MKLVLRALPAATLVAVMILSGCGGDGGGDTEVADHIDLAPIGKINDADITHFLNRTHFSATPTDVQAVKAAKLENYIDQMLVLPTGTQTESDAMASQVADPDFPSSSEIVRWWLYLMMDNPHPFQEVLAMFWHNHFATSTDVLGASNRYWMFDHLNLWRHDGAGNLTDLLEAMARDWTMLQWLDGYISTKNAPNENFAREFWELFTLGADNGYTQADIEEASRVFTGYRRRLVPDKAGPGRDQLIMEFDATRHDSTDKTIFGKTFTGKGGTSGAEEYRDMVEFTMQNRDVAGWICRNLWEYFVYLNPPGNLVDQLVKKLKEANWNLSAVLKTIFMSRAFYSDKARRALIKSPVEHCIGFARTTGLFISPTRMDWALSDIGQRPSRPPSVNGWPGGELWLSSQAMLERTNFLRDAVYYDGEPPQAGFDYDDLLVVGQPVTDVAIIDRYCEVLGVKLNNAQRQECITYLNTDKDWSNNVNPDPFNYSDPVQRDKKLRGLLYILAQHPSYQMK